MLCAHFQWAIRAHTKSAAAVEDLEALEDTLELLSDADAMADLREAAAARRTDQTIELTKEEAQARWSRG